MTKIGLELLIALRREPTIRQMLAACFVAGYVIAFGIILILGRWIAA